jgi:hypothetical protein
MAPSPRRKTALAKTPQTAQQQSVPGGKPQTAAAGKPTGPTPRPDPRTLNREARRREGRGNRSGRGNRGNRKPPPFINRRGFYDQNQEQQGQTLQDYAGYQAVQTMKGMQNYDPNNPYAGMSEQGFQSQMDQARQNVMNEFERSMGPQFEREEQGFRQRMAEQGIDPNSGAFQVQYQNMKEAQNAARQGAQAQAFQLGAGYQQQVFQQGMEGRRLPLEQLAATTPYFTQPYQTGMAGQQADLQRKFEAEQQQKLLQQRMEEAQLGARTSMGTAQLGAQTQRDIATMQMVNSQYGNQQQQQAPPWYNSVIQGTVQGGLAGYINYMNRPS